MTKVAIKGLLGRKLRTALTAFAIVLGVAMVSGTYVLTDTIKHGFDSIFTTAYSKADAVITGKTAFGNSNSVLAPSFPESVIDKVRAVPGTLRASGGVSDDETHLVGRDGKVISAHGAPNLGYSVDPAHDQGLNPLVLVQGKWPVGAHQIVIDAATAHKNDYSIGESIGVSVRGPTQQFQITGLAELGGVGSIGGATLSIFDLPTAQKLFRKDGQFDQIYVAAKPGVSPNELVSQIEPVLPPNTQVRTGTEEADKQAKDTDAFASILQKFLLAFGFVALFVGAFVIANTLSITIAQRTRELATLRTIGASRRQVLRSVLLEALVIGIVASVVGLFLGLLLAKGLNALFVSFGIDLPTNGTVFATRTVVVSLAIGIIVTLLASLRPAIRATRVPPIAAVREGSVLPQSRLERLGPFAAPLLAAIGIAGLLLGAFGAGSLNGNQRLLLLGIGILLVFVAVAIFAPRVVKPLTRFVGPIGTWTVTALSILVYPIVFVFWLLPAWILRRPRWYSPLPDRVVNNLAERNALRSPGRTASTAAALMIGLALVTLVAVLAAGLKSSFENAVKQQFAADYALTSQNGFTPTDASSAEAVRQVPQATAVVGVRAGIGKTFGSQHSVTGLDPGASQVLRLKWDSGSSEAALDTLGQSGAIVDNGFATDNHLALGSPIELLTPYGKTIPLKVTGIFKPPKGGSPLGSVTMSSATFDQHYPEPQNVYVLIKMEGGVTPENTKLLNNAVTDYPDAKIQTEAQFEHNQEQGIDVLLNLLFVLLGFSIVISLFGIVNTLVLTVFERTRELGMLRAVGMTRLQVRRMIRQESVVTALIGAALGIPLGVVLALLIGHAINFAAFAVPWGYLISFVIAAVLAGILAAIFPARRASRLNVLAALQYE